MNKGLYILMILAMIAWGETWISAKILSNYLSSDELIFWRFFFTSLGLLPVLIYSKISFKISKYNLILALLSSIILAFYNYAFFMGTKFGLASFGGVLVTTLNPIITFILITILSKKILHSKEVFGLSIGVIGALIMLKIWHFNINIILSKGNIYYLLASFLWPFLTLISAKQKNINALLFSFYMFLFTSIIDLFFIHFQISNIFKFDLLFWGNLLLLSLYGTTFATSIFFISVIKLGSKTSSSFFFLVPFSAIIFSIIFLNEKIQITLIIGGIFTIFSVYILNRFKHTQNNAIKQIN